MTAFYNENDRFACDWLSNLMDAGLITPGKIDDRSIHDVRPDDLAGFERVHFFAGIGGWDHALTLAGWSRPVWTGSCPCQPFSLAGKQKGFADDRHLWPVWRELIRERRPAVVFGEQVASASDWLRLVRSDLEALGYAVGAIPFQAASAGADHLRDRYGFVADDGSGRRDGPGERKVQQPRRAEAFGTGDCILADADNEGSQGRRLLPERSSERPAGPDGMAGNVGNTGGATSGRDARAIPTTQTECGSARRPDGCGADGAQPASPSFEWVIGADGKARRVKPGIRLLVDAFPNRVGLLRGFGNAIDPEAFAQFIGAAAEAINMTAAQAE